MTIDEIRAMLEHDEILAKRGEIDKLTENYTDDAIMIIGGKAIQGKADIKEAHAEMSKLLDKSVILRHGNIKAYKAGDTMLVLDQTFVESETEIEECRGIYVFKKVGNKWLCAIDNFYGVNLLDD